MAKPKPIKIPRIVQLPSGSWFCRVRVNGQDIPITDEDYNVVEAKAYAYKAGLLEMKKNPPDITVGQAVDEYIAARENILAPTTLRVYQQTRKHHFPDLMSVPLSKVTQSILQRHINTEARQYSPKTVKNSVALLQSALEDRVEDIRWKKLLLPQIRKGEVKTPSVPDLQKLIHQVAGTDIELLVLLPAWLSLRRSEMYGLIKSDFDTVNHTVYIQRGLITEGNKEKNTTPTKTFKSQRVILTDPYISSLVERLPDGPIFTLSRTTYSQRLTDACDAAGIPRATLQGLRHFNASAMAIVGVDTKYAMDRGGWSSEHTMRKVYQEIMDEGTQASAKKMNDFFHQMMS